MINKNQENILKYVNVVNNINELSKITKIENKKIESSILTLARKQLINKDKASQLLKDSPLIKLLEIPFNSQLKGTIPNKDTSYQKSI